MKFSTQRPWDNDTAWYEVRVINEEGTTIHLEWHGPDGNREFEVVDLSKPLPTYFKCECDTELTNG